MRQMGDYTGYVSKPSRDEQMGTPPDFRNQFSHGKQFGIINSSKPQPCDGNNQPQNPQTPIEEIWIQKQQM